jgi:glyoxylase-like metal-dependent hydrolase (beta-lactamase superfamily II)
MHLSGPFHFTSLELMPGVPLYVYAVRGERFSAIVDTGIAAMREAVLGLCREAGAVRYALITHAHADHIGNNRAVRGATGARFLAGGNTAWIEDLDRHYEEFCRPDRVPETPGQREEIMGLMDGPVDVDLVLEEGAVLRLGGVDLRVLRLPGHKLEEIGFLEPETGTLLTGDVLLALAAPFFHGFDTARGFRASLERLEGLLRDGTVRTVLAAHHAPMDAAGALEAVAATRRFLEDVEAATLEAAEGVTFESLWRAVCARLERQVEFRGHAMLEAQVRELEADGRLSLRDGRVFRAGGKT